MYRKAFEVSLRISHINSNDITAWTCSEPHLPRCVPRARAFTGHAFRNASEEYKYDANFFSLIQFASDFQGVHCEKILR